MVLVDRLDRGADQVPALLHGLQQPVLATRASPRSLVWPATVIAILLAACVPVPTTTPSGTPTTPTEPPGYALPRIDDFLERTGVCAGYATHPLVLRGRLEDGVAQVWAEPARGKAPIFWPRGFRALFDPDLVIVDQGGNVVAREGQDLTVNFSGLSACPMHNPMEIFVLRWPEPSGS